MKLRTALSAILSFGLVIGGGSAARSDALLDFLTFEAFNQPASAGMKAYRELHAEQAKWANEQARLRFLIEECGTCADRAAYEAELDYWAKTERDFQAISGSLADLVGMDPLVRNLLGIETSAAMGLGATGKPDPWFDFIKSDPPGWFEGSPAFCQKNYGALMACAQVTQDPRHKDCDDLMRVTDWCAAEDYAEAEQYIHIMMLRKGGMLIPEIRDIGWQLEVDFGFVPMGTDLIVPSGKDLHEYLTRNQFRKAIHFFFRRKSGGILDHAEYAKFNASSQFYPDHNRICGSASFMEKDPEACGFLNAMSNPMKDGIGQPQTAFVLSCRYPDQGTFDFWLHEKPAFATNPLTRRVSPRMADAPAADFCPVKYTTAQQLFYGRLNPDALKRADYTQANGLIHLGGDGQGETRVVSAAQSLARVTALVDSIRAEGLDLDAVVAADPVSPVVPAAVLPQDTPATPPQAAAPEPAAQPETPSAAPERKPLSLLGLSIGMPRTLALQTLRAAVGAPQAEIDFHSTDPGELFANATLLLGQDGAERALYFDGKHEDARLIGLYWKATDPDIKARTSAMSQQLAPLGAEHLEDEQMIVAGAEAGSPCLARPVNFPGGIDARTGRANGLKRAIFAQGLSVQHHDEMVAIWRDCRETILVRFGDDSFSAGLVDLAAALTAFEAR